MLKTMLRNKFVSRRISVRPNWQVVPVLIIATEAENPIACWASNEYRCPLHLERSKAINKIQFREIPLLEQMV